MKPEDPASMFSVCIYFAAEMTTAKEIKKIAIIGPECTGKSELSAYLAKTFDTVWIPEFARTYIDNLGRPYEKKDLLEIARGQIRLEDTLQKDARQLLICDTNLYVVKVWSIFKYGHVEEEILKTISDRKYDLYLLTYVDLPWEEDPQREHPHQRQELFRIYLEEMRRQTVPFVEIKGEREQRRSKAVAAVKLLLEGKIESLDDARGK